MRPIQIALTSGDSQFYKVCDTLGEAVKTIFDVHKAFPAHHADMPLDQIILRAVDISNGRTSNPWSGPVLWIGEED